MVYNPPSELPHKMPPSDRRSNREDFEAAVIKYFGEYGEGAVSAIMGHARHESAGTFHPNLPQVIGKGETLRYAKAGEGYAWGPLQFEEKAHEGVYQTWRTKNKLKDTNDSRVRYLKSSIFEKNSLGMNQMGYGNAKAIRQALQSKEDHVVIGGLIGERFLRAAEYQSEDWFKKTYGSSWQSERKQALKRRAAREEMIQQESVFYQRTGRVKVDFGD